MSVCPSTSAVRASVRTPAPIPAVVSENVTNKSCLICVQSEKYASWVNLTPQLDCCCRGEAEVRILDFKTTWSEFQKANQTATEQGNAKRISNQNVCSPPQSRSQAVVWVSTPRKYPHSGYFCVMLNPDFTTLCYFHWPRLCSLTQKNPSYEKSLYCYIRNLHPDAFLNVN